MTPEQYEQLKAEAPKPPAEYLAVAHVYASFLTGAQELSHALNHTLSGDESLPVELREAGQVFLDAIKEPMKAFQSALEAAAEATASPEVREFTKKVNAAMEPQVKLQDGVLDFSNKVVSGVSH